MGIDIELNQPSWLVFLSLSMKECEENTIFAKNKTTKQIING